MSLLVYGILSENTVNLNHIAESLPYWAKNDSLYKRFIRFLDKKIDLRGKSDFLRGLRTLKKVLRRVAIENIENIWKILVDYERKLRNKFVFCPRC